MLKKIENPDISKIDNKELLKLFDNEEAQALFEKSLFPYIHWEKIKYWNMPKGIDNLKLWAYIKLRRRVLSRKRSPIKDEKEKSFTWISSLSKIEKVLHEIDMRLGGNLFISQNQFSDELKHRLLSRGVMEEAIASSQLEGAHTSRKVAKQILLEGKKPNNKSEQMIVNNYQAMKLIETDLKDKKLDEEILFNLHEILTKEVLKKSDIGRYRKDRDEIIVGGDGSEIYHIPPKEAFVKKEIKRLIAYANNEIKENDFIHPVLKAIIIHFWIGYLHPFVDGNGRMARTLFYWYLLKENYWAFAYLPLSKVIKNSPAQYRDAYIYSEQDDNDLTYFIEYNINKIEQAMREFEEYAERKWKENTKMAKLSRDKYQLNDRQIQLLRYYYKNKDSTTSITTHMKVYETSRMTATNDLKDLLKKGFLRTKKVGRTVFYYATEKVNNLFD
ncbi:MAG: Fic family protein [Candidatus Pacebacteria bacterium]|nr:Fic family protein [Candidatus Paceibacterota bacterium]